MYAKSLNKAISLLLTFVLLFTAMFAVSVPSVAAAAGEVTLTASSTDVVAGTPFTLSVSAPGATAIELYHWSNSSNSWSAIDSATGSSATFAQQGTMTQTFLAGAVINGAWVYSSAVTVNVSYLGTLETPVYSAPSTVAAGQDYVITWTDVPLAGYYVFDVLDSNGQLVMFDDVTAGTQTIALSTAGLTPGTYTIVAYPDALGYERVPAEWDFTVTEAKAVTLTASSTNVVAGTPFTLTVSAPGATAIELYRWSNSSNSWSKIDSAQGASATFEQRWTSTQVFNASAYIGGQWVYADAVTVSVSYLGTLEKPNYSAASSVASGQDYVVTWTDVPVAEYYGFDLLTSNHEYINTWYTEAGKQTITIPMTDVAAGSYIVNAYPECIGYDNSSAMTTWNLLVTEPVAAEGEVVLSVNSTRILKDSPSVISVDAPGASAIRLYRWSNSAQAWELYREAEGEAVQYTFWPSVTRAYCASACFDGVWSEQTETVTVEVYFLGTLAAPSVTAANTVEAGTAYTITWTDVKNAEEYGLDMLDGQNDGEYMDSWYGEEGENSLTIPMNYPAGTYTFVFAPIAEGWDVSEAVVEWDVTVTGTLGAAPAISADKTTVLRGDEVDFTISAPGATEIMVQYEYWAGRDYYDVVDGTVSFSATYWESEGIRVAALVDGKWSAWSDWLYITVESAGKLEKPTVSAVTAVAGQPFAVAWNAIDNAEEYCVTIYDNDLNQIHYDWMFAEEGTSYTFNFPLESGSYLVGVLAYSSGAYDNSEETLATLTITGEMAAGPSVTVEATQAYVGESVYAAVATGNAERIAIRRERNDREPWITFESVNENTEYYEIYKNSSGWVKAEYSLYVNGAWTAWSEPVTVTFISKGALDTPVITLPESITAGQQFTISWNAVENADYYYVYIYDGDYDYIDDFYREDEDAENGVLSLTPRLPLGAGQYHIEVNAYGAGYESAYAEKTMSVTGEFMPAPTVTVEKTQFTPGEEITFTVEAEGLTEVIARYQYEGESWYNTNYFEADTTGVVEPWFFIYEEDVFCFSFSGLVNGVWTAFSDPIAITLAYTDALDSTVVTLDQESYAAGEDITVSWNAIENAERYWIGLYKNGGLNTSWNLNDVTQTSLTTSFPITAGTYYFEVTAYADGYRPSESQSANFAVTGELIAGPTVSASATVVEQGDSVTASVNDSGAEFGRIKVHYPSGSYTTYTCYPNENGVIEWTSSLREEGTYYFSACVYANGMWTDYGAATAVTVTKVAGPTVTVPADAKAGEEITVAFSSVEGAEEYNVVIETLEGEWINNVYIGDPNATSGTFEAGDVPAGTYNVYATAWLYGLGIVKGETVQMTVAEPDPDKAFTYRVYSGDAWIQGYLGSAPTELTIPESIDGYPVTDVDGLYPADLSELKRVVIPANVTYLASNLFEDCTGLTIAGYTGSFVEEYALRRGYAFERLDDGDTGVSATWGEVLINAQTQFIITAPGVLDVQPYVNGSYIGCETKLTEDGAIVTMVLEEPGENVVRFMAGFGEEWINSPCYLITPVSYGKMAAPTNVTASNMTPYTCEEVTFTWDAVEGAENGYNADIIHADEDYEEYQINRSSAEQSHQIGMYDTFKAGTYHFYVETIPVAGYEPSDRVKLSIEFSPKGDFDYCGGYYNAIIGYYGTDTDVVIPAEIDGVKIEMIYTSAFEEKDIESVVIPEGVRSIGYYAFNGCESLKNVVLPSTLYSIDNWAFGNTAIESIVIPASVEYISSYAFGYPVDGFTVYGYTGTEAETFAGNKGYTFIALDDTTAQAATFTMNATSVEQNGTLTLSVSAPDAQSIRVYLDSECYEEVFVVTDGAATCEVNVGQTLGERTVAIAQCVNGVWSEAGEAQTFTVTESTAKTVTLTLSETSVVSGSPITFTISAPGATAVRLEHLSSDGTQWRTLVEEEGESAILEMQWSMAWTVRASACFDDSWDYHSESIETEITYLGTLEKPVYSAPETVEAGEDYVITWTDVPEAGYYVFDVLGEGGEFLFSDDVTAGVETFTISTADLEPGVYTVIAYPDCIGWQRETTEWQFTVEAPGLAIAPEAHLMIIGEKRLIEVTCPVEETPVYTWTSSDETVATVENGVVTAKALGEAEITVTATFADGSTMEAACAVCVANLGTYRLPSSLTTIEEEAFNVGGAQCIILGDQVTSVGAKAFANNDELMLLIVEGENTTVDPTAVENCINVTVVCHKNSNVHLTMESKGISCVFIGE